MPRRLRNSSIVALALLCSASTLAAAAPGGKAGPAVVVSKSDPFASCTKDAAAAQPGVNFGGSEIEPYIDVNPLNPKGLIAGWQQDRWSNGGSRGLVAGYSKDGGKTWKTSIPRGTSLCAGGKWQRSTDPWVSFGANGTAFFFTLAFDNDPPDGGFGPSALYVHRSTDGGATWSRPVTLIEDDDPLVFSDKNSLTADSNDPNYAYATWDRLELFNLESLRGFEGIEEEEADSARPQQQGERVLLGERLAQARVLRARRQGPTDPEPTDEPNFRGPTFVSRTINGGQSWDRARIIHDPGINAQTINNLIEVTPQGLVDLFFTEIIYEKIDEDPTVVIGLKRSFDKGFSFLPTQGRLKVADIQAIGTVTPDKEEPVRDAAILFDTAVDPKTGRLYVVWQDARFRSVDEIAFSQSTDRGRTWSKPIRINRTPKADNKLLQQAFVPSVAVGRNGRIWVTYYDFRNDTDKGELADAWAVYCDPVGKSCASRNAWSKDLRLTDSSFDITDAPLTGAGWFLGDYMGLAGRGGSVHALFGVTDGPGRTKLVTRKLD